MKKLTTPVDKSILPKMDEGSASAYNTAISNLTAPRTQYVNIVTRIFVSVSLPCFYMIGR